MMGYLKSKHFFIGRVAGLVALVAGCTSISPDGPIVDPAEKPPVETADTDPLELGVEPADEAVLRDNDLIYATAAFAPRLNDLAPDLDARLRAEALQEAKAMEADARSYRTEEPDFFRMFGYGMRWTLLGAAGDIVSLKGETYYETGGAHPNTYTSGLIYDRSTGQDLYILRLFADEDLAESLLIDLIRDDLTAQKIKRLTDNGIEADGAREEVEAGISPSGTPLREAALIQNKDGGLFGGLQFFYAPYEVGPYAEGAYTVTIGQAEIRDLINDAYLPLFGGTPVLTPQD